jgi:hypothetical protein
MSEDNTKVDASIMSDIDFDVVPTLPVPEIWVTGLNGEQFKNRLSHERFTELVQQLGDAVHEHLTQSLEQMAKIASEITSMETDEERALAAYIVRSAAWTFVKQSEIPLFLFSPRSIPEEMLVEANETLTKSFTPVGKRGFNKVRKGGKKTYSRKNDRRPKKL